MLLDPQGEVAMVEMPVGSAFVEGDHHRRRRRKVPWYKKVSRFIDGDSSGRSSPQQEEETGKA